MIEFDQPHTDLTYPLQRIGYAGGPKAIKQVLGIARREDTTEITGFDTVRLWHECERGSDDALSLLLKCERGMWWILKRSSSLRTRSLLKRCFRLRVGLADVNRS